MKGTLMYFYRVGYTDYERADTVVLMHCNKFDHDLFLKMVGNAANDVAQKRLDEIMKALSESNLVYDERTLYFYSAVRFDDIYKAVADQMISRFGFEIVKYVDGFHGSTRHDFSNITESYDIHPDTLCVANSLSYGLSCPIVPPKNIGTHEEMIASWRSSMENSLIPDSGVIGNSQTMEGLK